MIMFKVEAVYIWNLLADLSSLFIFNWRNTLRQPCKKTMGFKEIFQYKGIRFFKILVLKELQSKESWLWFRSFKVR